MDFKRQTNLVGVDDLVLLSTLNERAITDNLKQRFAKDIIYTAIGNVLISVNPFKRLPIYTDDHIKYYRANSKQTTQPHIFALAEDTYRSMVQEEENQCIIISGESGAGKTEASKQIMQYIAAVSGNSKDMQHVKHVMLESNPVLEAFGNAKTVRNDNSSRFGKFFEIYFDTTGGPRGGKISNFLLEKSRVVRQQKGERNFHIFYQLCCGADDALRTKLRLRPPGEFSCLNQGGTLERAGVSDVEEFKETVSAMTAIGLTKEQQFAVFELLAAILHLSELKFVSQGEECVIGNPDVVDFVASLLKVDSTLLARSMCWKKLDTGTEVINVPLDQQQCVNCREALSKAIYAGIFDYIVESVNDAFGRRPYALMIGVLDIYGFEIFEKNGFEQFCINYVNEKLQQIFIELTLKVEQEEYVKEKIKWEPIKFFNNKIVCDLIEGKQPPGIFLILDDVCATMSKEKENVADIKLLDKLDGAQGLNQHFKRTDRGFFIKHYAGDVQYESAGFTSRNKDTLSPDLMVVVKDTQNDLLVHLFRDIEVDTSQSANRSGAKKKSTTAGYKIRNQAAELVKTLMTCTPHYVRTVKSNDVKQGGLFDDPRVLHQVKYLGLLENVRVRRAGFSYRQHFDKFLKRYKYLCPQTYPRPWKGDDKSGCVAILRHVSTLPAEAWQLGETKVFIRQPQHLFHLEDLREQGFGDIIYKIQRAWRRYRTRKVLIKLRAQLTKMYKKGGKQRRADSVFRPYFAEYVELRGNDVIASLLEYKTGPSPWTEYDADGGRKYYYNAATGATVWERPKDMEKQIVKFTQRVLRVVNHTTGQQLYELLIITDQRVYLIEERYDTIVTPPTKPTRQNPNPPPPPAPYTVVHHIVKKRMELRDLRALSVSPYADTFLVLHMNDAPVPHRAVAMTPAKGVKQCERCLGKLLASAKKGNCAVCGQLMCMKCLTCSQVLPTLGYNAPTRVCSWCVNREPCEPPEDTVLNTTYKTEVCSVLRMCYKGITGQKMPICVSDVIDYTNRWDNPKANKVVPRQITFHYNHQISEAQLYVAANQIVVHSPPGVPQAEIDKIEVQKEQRRQAAIERHKREMEEEKKKEEEKERQREEQRKKEVEERKRLRREQEEAEERERQEKESRVRERKEREARIVAERSTAGPAKAAAPACTQCSCKNYIPHPFKQKMCVGCQHEHS
eukprot:PhM_4_TR11938/c0_g1_i1/m.75870/K10356/MYO1; myosin I